MSSLRTLWGALSDQTSIQEAGFKGAVVTLEGRLDSLIAALLRGEAAPWTMDGEAAYTEKQFLSRVRYQGVDLLVYPRLAKRSDWPSTVAENIRRTSLERTHWELRHRSLLSKVLSSLQTVGIIPIVFKGTALAYSLYQSPASRARADTDILIREADLARCRDILKSHGLANPTGIPGDQLSHEETWVSMTPESGYHAIDLHYQINNSNVLSQLFTYDELYSSGSWIEKDQLFAWIPSRVHSLLIACMHREVHKFSPFYLDGKAIYDGNKLIWLYDISLLARSFDSQDWNYLADAARTKGLSASCVEGLELAVTQFACPFPPAIQSRLKVDDRNSTVTMYLRGSELKREFMNYRAISGVQRKLKFLAQLFFPPSDYMRWKYRDSQFSWLPWLYLRRAVEGLGDRFLRRSDH
jgi:hypothetical protein